MKKTLTTAIFLIPVMAFAQATFDWGAHYASNGNARVEDAAIDSKGNVYTVGSHQDTLNTNCNNTNTSKTNTDNDWADYIQQVKPDGTLGYIKGLGGTDYSFAKSVGVDKEDNVYMAGSFKGTHNPGVSITSKGDIDIYVLKYSPTGVLLWAKSFGSTGEDRIGAMEVDPDGNVYIGAAFKGDVDFDPSNGTHEIKGLHFHIGIILKLDKSGSFQWVKQTYKSTNTSLIHSLALDNNGNIFTTGFFIGKTIFYLNNDSVTYNAGNQDVFIQKLDKNGDFQWAKKIGGTGIDQGHAIAVGPDGDVVITGQFKSSTMSLNPDPNAVNPKKVSNAGTRYDIFFVKLKGVDGEYVWGHGFYGGLDDYGRALAIDKDGYIYLAGEIAQSVNFELDATKPGKTKQSKGGLDAFLARYDKDGNLDWVESYGSTGSDFIRALYVSEDFDIVLGGGFRGAVDLDHTTGTRSVTAKTGFYDGYAIKMKEQGNGGNSSIRKSTELRFNTYPNPVKSILTIDTDKRIKSLKVYSLQGKLILEQSGDQKRVDVISLEHGMYSIQVEYNNSIGYAKFIKN